MEVLSALHDQNHMIDKVENAAFGSNPQSSFLEIAPAIAASKRIVFKASTTCAK